MLVTSHPTAELYLDDNSLRGTIPSQIGLFTKLSEYSVVWLLVVMIVLSCVSHCTLMLACPKISESSVVWLLACCNDCVVMCF